MNKFYSLSPLAQSIISKLMFGLFLLLCLFWGLWLTKSMFAIIGVFFLVPVFQFLCTPHFRLSGVYTYLSPMLLVYNASDEKYDLHNGTSFDYLLMRKEISPGKQWQKKLLGWYVEGFLNIISKIEMNQLPESVKVRGGSYFFSETTARRLGFEIGSMNMSERLNVYINYLDLLWMYSLSKGRIAFPNLSKLKTVTTTGDQLLLQKEHLIALHHFLKR